MKDFWNRISAIFSRKFLLVTATYIAFVVFFAMGKLSEAWFCGSLLGLSFFYYLANVWQKSIENYEPDIGAIVEALLPSVTKQITKKLESSE